jgi:hypothetical protein
MTAPGRLGQRRTAPVRGPGPPARLQDEPADGPGRRVEDLAAAVSERANLVRLREDQALDPLSREVAPRISRGRPSAQPARQPGPTVPE